MAVDKNQVRDLLGSGLSNEIVASAVGCDPSYITQLMSDEAFASEVIALRTAALTANNKRDRRIDSVEDDLIKKLDESVQQGLFYKPNDLLRAFAVVNNAKRRGVPATESVTINQTVVNLSLPVAVQQKFVTNVNGEVIEVNDKTLVTMPSHQLLQELAGTKDSSNGQPNKYDKVRSLLPAAALLPATAPQGS